MSLRDELVLVGWMWQSLRKSVMLWIFIFLQTQANNEAHKEARYIWRTGQWGRCIGEDCGPNGVQSRTVWCVHIEGWTTHHSHCKYEERPEIQRDCFKVCDWHHELFEWEFSKWGDCALRVTSKKVKSRTSNCVTAQQGLQHRKVHCIRKSNRSLVLDEICEFFTPKPASDQACLIPCPQDCVVSELSAWSACSKGCGKGLQHRIRSVLSPPLYGGKTCPSLTETKGCDIQVSCLVGEDDFQYSLKVGPWSDCRLPHQRHIWQNGKAVLNLGLQSSKKNDVKHQIQQHSKPRDVEIGYQTRHVHCTRSDGKNAMLSLCIHGDTPAIIQSCVMPTDCEFSEWSGWTSCTKTCQSSDYSPGYRSRIRFIKHVAVGGGKDCPNLEEKETCNIGGEGLPSCPRYIWKTTDWNECQVTPLLSQQDRRRSNQSALCGGGIQTREVYCAQKRGGANEQKLKEASKPVDKNLCTEPIPVTSQLCNIACPTDCLVSAWSAWRPCIPENCQDPQNNKGFKMRRRHVVREPTGNTGRCPHLVESIHCEEPVCYHWHLLEDSLCVAENYQTCGRGTFNQTALCKSNQGEVTLDELCGQPYLPSSGMCELPCPTDCVLSEWSEWSGCSRSCSSRNAEGRQSRTRSILALAGEGAKPCPSSKALQEGRSCNEHGCTVFYWDTSPWGPCIEDTLVMPLNATMSWNGEATCSVGMQTRQIHCMKNKVGHVTPKRCPESIRRETVRPCLLPCKKDCVVTPFSEWTPCPTMCQQGNSSLAKQSRHRIIIQKPNNRGQECPDTLYEERECEARPLCPNYRWKIHKWHHCILAPGYVRQGTIGAAEVCGSGLQSRGVTCTTDDDQNVDLIGCLKSESPIPVFVQKCRIPCHDDCMFTNWSKFTPCAAGCGSTHSRRRSLIGKSKKKGKCHKDQLVETKTCPCDKFIGQPQGNWSDCILPENMVTLQLGMKFQGDVKDCGQGVHYRAIACYDQNKKLVNPWLCSNSGYIEETCSLPCPSDCKLSDWSNWSACSKSCGSGVQIRSKWLREKSYNSGRPCLKLDVKNQVYDRVPCYRHCSQYSWIAESWSVCRINNRESIHNCGEGVQTRKVRCMNNTADGPGESVDDALCDYDEMPVGARQCSLPCPKDCVMSDWGHWSICPKECNILNIRVRTRYPLRLAADGKTCPEASEVEPCTLNKNCFYYHYNLTEWSSCQLSDNAVCGQGLKFRLLDCAQSDGKSVDVKLCEKMGLESPWHLSMYCFVECPVNCQLSEWSSWSECSRNCGLEGQMKRTRHVLQKAHGEGRPCFSQLSQHRPCLIKPCYSWVFGEWSACKVEGAQCGDGLKVRNLSCVVHDGKLPDSAKVVENEMCGNRPIGMTNSELELKVPCSVPCPGDCHLTEWSSWSSCQLICLDGKRFETSGRQTHSRAVIVQALGNQDNCPEQIWEQRSCTGNCHEYEWRSSPWNGNERTVWCVRSDGVNVTGGCSSLSQPAATRHCHPSCTKPYSFCTQGGVCGCEKGYVEVMTPYGFLDYCTKIPGREEKKADVKTSVGKNKLGNSKFQAFFKGWSIDPFDPDGKPKVWVYGVSAAIVVLIIFITVLSYLICKKPKQQARPVPQQKPLTLAYDGDMDM
ncbi:thrombospondin type-1 domain-containing protein 7B isoform X2 [Scyliorhinus canicula]|uniref:thrombospondin type-1 domain-containing protein 7B isoform X2 n=1 Tax=Scyliorhinus canicula TaxID=7830 RepID=UPI0018F71E14|nr:thrombospondin type-1 domain-containing protein 7B isoform X2 [Scyliorhinus canicula]